MELDVKTDITFKGDSDYVFLTCSSFEERTVSVPLWLQYNVTKSPALSYLFYSRAFSSTSEPKRKQVLDVFGDNVEGVELRNSDPLYSTDRLLECIENNYDKFGKLDYLIDVTTFTREWLYILLAIINQYRDKVGTIYISYNSAQNMSQNWLTKGNKDFRTVLGYSGEIYPSKKTHLVIILGHEFERASAIIDYCEPHIISVGIGAKEKSISEDMWKENVRYLEELKTYYSMEIRDFTLDLANPLAAKADIERELSGLTQFNTILAPLNTKMSSIGACLFALENPQIQMCYLQMELYNTLEYSTPSKDLYFYTIF